MNDPSILHGTCWSQILPVAFTYDDDCNTSCYVLTWMHMCVRISLSMRAAWACRITCLMKRPTAVWTGPHPRVFTLQKRPKDKSIEVDHYTLQKNAISKLSKQKKKTLDVFLRRNISTRQHNSYNVALLRTSQRRKHRRPLGTAPHVKEEPYLASASRIIIIRVRRIECIQYFNCVHCSSHTVYSRPIQNKTAWSLFGVCGDKRYRIGL